MAHNKVPPNADLLVVGQLCESAEKVEELFQADLLAYSGPIHDGTDRLIRRAVEFRKDGRPRRRRLLVVLTTGGGYIETAERIADVFRKHYSWVGFAVLDQAMSAGTVLVMSGDEIYMDYFSRLGPIDPQVERPDGSVSV